MEDGYSISARGIVAENGSNFYIDLDYYTIPETIVFTSPFLADGMKVLQITYSQTEIVIDYIYLASSNQTLTIGSYTYDGSSAVNIPVYDGTYTWG